MPQNFNSLKLTTIAQNITGFSQDADLIHDFHILEGYRLHGQPALQLPYMRMEFDIWMPRIITTVGEKYPQLKVLADEYHLGYKEWLDTLVADDRNKVLFDSSNDKRMIDSILASRTS